MRVTVVTDDGGEHDTFLKPSGRPEMGLEGMANEALAAMLAADLGLPISEIFAVEIGEEFVAGIGDPATHQVLENSSPVCFASKDAGRQWGCGIQGSSYWLTGYLWRWPSPHSTPSSTMMIAEWGNPNLLVKGSEFRVIDHELAFRLRLKLIPRPEPWKAGYLNKLVEPDGHPLARKLQKTKNLDGLPIKGAWVGLSDARIETYLTCLPKEWAAVMPAMEEAANHIRSVRDRIDECLGELIRALT